MRLLEEREKQHGADVWGQVERLVLLRTIDTLWVDHLTELDDMRRGIGLRGYGGIDPLNEFKREAFKLYEELRGFISKQVANTIFKVQVTAAPQQQTFPMPIPAQFGETSTDGNGAQARRDHARRWRPRPLRRHVPRGCPAAGLGAGSGRGVDDRRRRHGRGGRQHAGAPARSQAASTATSQPARRLSVGRAGKCREARSQRCVLVRQRQEVQALSRSLTLTETPSARILDWEGCLNVRDLGGLTTADGRTIRWGALVRSDIPTRLTDVGATGSRRPRHPDDPRSAISG